MKDLKAIFKEGSETGNYSETCPNCWIDEDECECGGVGAVDRYAVEWWQYNRLNKIKFLQNGGVFNGFSNSHCLGNPNCRVRLGNVARRKLIIILQDYLTWQQIYGNMVV